jgi:hypothetical protein
MFKNVISPIQAWLMSQGKCVGCGMPLSKAKKSTFKKDFSKVTCKCGRIFIFDQKKKTYRRALLEEV